MCIRDRLKTAWQVNGNIVNSTIANYDPANKAKTLNLTPDMAGKSITLFVYAEQAGKVAWSYTCLLYTSPSPRDGLLSRMPSSA